MNFWVVLWKNEKDSEQGSYMTDFHFNPAVGMVISHNGKPSRIYEVDLEARKVWSEAVAKH